MGRGFQGDLERKGIAFGTNAAARDSGVEHQLLADAARTLNGKQVALLEVKLQDHPVKPVRDHLLFAGRTP